MVATARDPYPRKTRGSCDEAVSKTLRFAGMRLTRASTRCQRCAAMPRKPKPPSCEDCYFRRNLLCALELEEPCTTFRPGPARGPRPAAPAGPPDGPAALGLAAVPRRRIGAPDRHPGDVFGLSAELASMQIWFFAQRAKREVL